MKAGHLLGLAASLAVLAADSAQAQDMKVVERFSKGEIRFEIPDAYSNVTLSISGPGGVHEQAFSRREAPDIELVEMGELEDGVYTYQLTAATEEVVRVRPHLDNGRSESVDSEERVGVTRSGTFRIRNGAIMPAEQRPERGVTGGAEGDDQDRKGG